jgi:protein-S-isoprenylcysteine O-methyltransferase Ste14
MQFALCLLILAIGVLTLSLEISLDNYDDYEDAFEWILALLIHVNFLLAWWGWRTTTHSSASQG